MIHGRRWLPVLAALLLGGCASNVPDSIRHAPASAVSPAEARADATRLQGVIVRWGGVIAGVENRRDTTELDIVARPLAGDGSPLERDVPKLGRFIARITGFLDPEVYKPGREITVRGPFTGIETRPIGDYPYRYPIVQAQQYYLWPVAVEPPPRAYDPFWYDPWYPYPWWYRHPHYWHRSPYYW